MLKYINRLEKFAIDNSPAILTAVGVVGSVTTAYLTGKAGFKSAKIIADAQFKENLAVQSHPLTNSEKTRLVWKQFVLPAATGTLTCAAIVGANHISTRRMAALAAGYTLLDGRFEEYKTKIKEKLGAQKEEKARDELTQDRVNQNPPVSTLVIASGKSLFKDEPSGRYFESDMETIRRAQNDTNEQILSKEYAVLTDFYERIGLPPTSLSEEFGWDISNEQMDIQFSTAITHDGRPCICMDYNIHPIRNGSPNQPSRKIHAV